MLFSEEEIQAMKKEAYAPKPETDGFNYDPDVAKGEVHVLWQETSSFVFENNHGCWDMYPTIN